MWWAEARPTDGGRVVVVRRDAAGTVSDVLPEGWSARTRVHEYGGTAWLPLPGRRPGLRELDRPAALPARSRRRPPVPLTPEPAEPAALRYADPVPGPGGDEIWWVREAHAEAGQPRALVAVPLSGAGASDPAAVREIVARKRLPGLAAAVPRRPPGGLDRLGPPADAVGRHRAAGRRRWARTASWRRRSRCWAASRSRCCSRSGWTRTRWPWSATGPAGGTSTGWPPPAASPEPLCPRAEEFGQPLWMLGQRTYGVLADGRLAVAARHRHDHARACSTRPPAS